MLASALAPHRIDLSRRDHIPHPTREVIREYFHPARLIGVFLEDNMNRPLVHRITAKNPHQSSVLEMFGDQIFPSIVVMNNPAAGSLAATNLIYNDPRKNGALLGVIG